METIATGILLIWATGGLFLSFLLLKHFGSPNWNTQQRLLAGLGIYLFGLVVLYLGHTAITGA